MKPLTGYVFNVNGDITNTYPDIVVVQNAGLLQSVFIIDDIKETKD